MAELSNVFVRSNICQCDIEFIEGSFNITSRSAQKKNPTQPHDY